MTETTQLTALLRERYSALDDAKEVAISPGKLAVLVYAVLDPDSVAPTLVTAAAILELKQLARAVCRSRHNNEAQIAEKQGSLFDFHLQTRYPATRDDDEVYVLLDHLSHGEICQNEQRLRKEADAKTVHAEALAAYDAIKFGDNGDRKLIDQVVADSHAG